MTNIHKNKNSAAWVAFIASFFVLGLKTYAYYQTNSAAILSDAVESIVNVVTSIIALYVINYVSQPADEDHPYGHGKAEYFSAAFEGGLIFLASIWIVLESLRSLLQGSSAHQIENGFVWISLATGINLGVGLYLRYIGKKTKSEALEASGLHILSDVYTTVGVMIGLVLVIVTGWKWMDSAIAIIVGAQLSYESFKIVRGALGALIDQQDNGTLKLLTQALNNNRVPGIIDIHHLRTIRAGQFHHIDAHLVVPQFWEVGHVHEVTHAFEERVVAEYPYDGEIAFHLDPCNQAYCRNCALENCSLRKVSNESTPEFKMELLVKGPKTIND